NPNPFAVLVLAHLKTMETREDFTERQNWKSRLIKGLYNRGMSREDVRQFFRVIDWMMDLPPVLDGLFWDDITHYQEEKQMPFITTPERIGRLRGLLEGIELALELKFGEAGLQLLPEIKQLADVETVHTVLQAIKTVTRPEELRQFWAPE